MIQAKTDSVDRLRDGWERQWLRDSAGSSSERSAMLDIHAVLHAASHLLASSVEPVRGLGAILADAERRLELADPRVGDPTSARASADALRLPRADLAELLLVHDERGRTASPGLAGEIDLTAQIVRRVLPAVDPLGVIVPVLAAAGEKALRVERSRPDWHLNGTVRGVAWDPGADLLGVFAVDEGDNDVLALVAPAAARVEITSTGATGSGRTLADIRFDDVTLPTVAHCPGEPAALADGLTVLAMADVIGAVSRLLDRPRAELELCRASLRAAAASLTSSSVIRRQHDVSAAALLVLPACLRLVAEAQDQDDPDVAKRVQRVREQVLALPAWHRERLVALI